MAKDPKKGLSDEDIVRLRDDAAYPDRARALRSPEARRALAESRLRALAISLTANSVTQPYAGMPNDDELLEYLLADMAEDRRRVLESRLRGTPRAFERLVKLHELTSAHVNHRDLRHADMAERKIERYDLGRFEIRMRSGRLAFRRVDEQDAPPADLSLGSLSALRVPDAVMPAVEDFYDDDTLGQIERLLFRCCELAAQIRQLTDAGNREYPNALASLKRIGRLPAAKEELAESIRQLQRLGYTLERETRESGKSRPQPGTPSHQIGARNAEFLSPMQMKERALARKSTSRERDWETDWLDKAVLAAGPWEMMLMGATDPVKNVEVLIVNSGLGSSMDEPFLTIIQPGNTFELIDLSADGKAVLPLMKGRNLLLLQASAVWAVHLNFSSSE